MRTRLGLVLLLSSLAACGGGDDAAIFPDAERGPDAEPAIDAEIPDAEPEPDAMVTADLSCADDPQPIDAPDPIVINGLAQSASLSGAADLVGATLEAYRIGNPTAVASDISDADGLFTLTVANAGLVPVDGYVKGTAATYLDSYLYPPFPLSASTPETPTLFVTNDTLNLLAFVSGATQRADHGVLGILVLDCAGNPAQGAVVTISPTQAADPPTKIVYMGDNMVPDTNLTSTGMLGLAFVFNAPEGDVVVDASVGGVSLDEHTIDVRIGAGFPAITQTAVAPGPITP